MKTHEKYRKIKKMCGKCRMAQIWSYHPRDGPRRSFKKKRLRKEEVIMSREMLFWALKTDTVDATSVGERAHHFVNKFNLYLIDVDTWFEKWWTNWIENYMPYRE